jgi:hypothetical protein
MMEFYEGLSFLRVGHLAWARRRSQGPFFATCRGVKIIVPWMGSGKFVFIINWYWSSSVRDRTTIVINVIACGTAEGVCNRLWCSFQLCKTLVLVKSMLVIVAQFVTTPPSNILMMTVPDCHFTVIVTLRAIRVDQIMDSYVRMYLTFSVASVINETIRALIFWPFVWSVR